MDHKKIKVKSALINRALGLFIFFFGLVIIVATKYTTTDIGFKTNLVAGLVLSLIGCGMWVKSTLDLKKIKSEY